MMIGNQISAMISRRTSAILSRRMRFSSVANDAHAKAPIEEPAETVTKKPLTFGRFMLYAAGVSASSFFLYNLYEAGGNLHTTEILMGRKLAKLPFYYPPGPPVSVKNSSLPATPELPTSLVDQLSAWFIHQDSVSRDGITRADILDLFGDKFGLVDNDKPESGFQDESLRKVLTSAVDQFVEKGKGRLTEYKRRSGVSIQETLEFLNDLVAIHKQHSSNIENELAKMSSILHEELGRIVDTPSVLSVSQPSLPDVEDVSEREVLLMELSQLERSRDDILKNRSESALSDAERERVISLETQIGDVRKLLESC